MAPGGAPTEHDKSRIQSLLFARDLFEPKEARAWAKEHGFSARKIDTTESFHRIRQRDPDDFDPESFRTIRLTDGVKAIVGRPWPDLEE